MGEVAAGAAAWALTVALHLVALGAAAAALERALPRADAGARELLWRIVLLGSFATASLQLVAGIDPVAGTLHTLADGPLDAVVEPGEPAPVGGLSGGAPEAAASAATFPWRDAAVAVWLVLAAAGLAALAMSYATLRRRLAPRTEDPDLRALAAELAWTVGLRRVPAITRSPCAPTPLALGVRRPEVCVPERAVAELDDAGLRALLAHELAHVARHDPAWALVYAAVCRVMFWHPLAWLVRRRLLGLAELRCDAIARGSSADAGVALARVLVRAAEWLADAPRGLRAVHGHAMAATRSGLHTRVRALLAAQPEARGRSGLLRAGALLLCTAAPVMLPDVRPPSGAPEPAALLAGALPAPIATLLRDVAALRDEVAAL